MLGIERGIERSGLETRTVAYVEREAFVCFNLANQMEKGMVDAAPIWTDCTTFDGKPFRNRIHGIVGGYPCQGESSAGLRQLERDPRYLWPHIERIICEINPLFCFFENVDGHLSGTFSYVLRSLRNIGYAVEAGIYSAAEVGAPHSRKRVFILACSDPGELRGCLANANSRFRGLPDKSEREKTVAINESRGNVGNAHIATAQDKRFRNESAFPHVGGACIDVANAVCNGSGKGMGWKQSKQFDKNDCEWPARPGVQQKEWEQPRIVKSGLGCTVDGYNFRIDLLRMYGNGVVEQTAEKAWIELTKKITK